MDSSVNWHNPADVAVYNSAMAANTAEHKAKSYTDESIRSLTNRIAVLERQVLDLRAGMIFGNKD